MLVQLPPHPVPAKYDIEVYDENGLGSTVTKGHCYYLENDTVKEKNISSYSTTKLTIPKLIPSYNGVKSNIQLAPYPLNTMDLKFSYYSFEGDKYYTNTVNFDTMPLLSGYMNSIVVHWQSYHQ